MKNTITEMKNTLEGINSRLNDTEEQISELEDKRDTLKFGVSERTVNSVSSVGSSTC